MGFPKRMITVELNHPKNLIVIRKLEDQGVKIKELDIKSSSVLKGLSKDDLRPEKCHYLPNGE